MPTDTCSALGWEVIVVFTLVVRAMRAKQLRHTERGQD